MEIEKLEILEKIGKLLALSKDQAEKPEGIAAKAMASKLMAKYQIAESELEFSSGTGGNILEDKEGWQGLCDEGGKRQWVSDLAWHLSQTFSCKYWISPSNNSVHFIGSKGDLETVLYFMDIVYNHVERNAWESVPSEKQWRKRNVFGQAAIAIVGERLKDLFQSIQEEIKLSNCTDIIVVKNDAVAKITEDIFKARGFGYSRNSSVKAGYNDGNIIAAGRLAGKTAPLNKAIA